MQTSLFRMNRARSRYAAAALAVSYPLLHKGVSDICDWASGAWGFAIYDRVALIGIPLVSGIALVSIYITRHRVADLSTNARVGCAALLVLTAVAQRWLMVANIELIHFPQFALLAGVCLSIGLSGPLAYLFATTAGALDETYQHLVVYAGRSDTYFDINDIVLDAIGAAWAVVFLGSVASESPAPASRMNEWRWFGRASHTGVLVGIIAIAVWCDPPEFGRLLRQTPSGRTSYRVLSLAEGIAVCAVLWDLVVWVRSAQRTRPVGEVVKKHSLARMVLFLVILMTAGCATATGSAAPLRVPPAPDEALPFITTFWCGPPHAEFDDARAAEIAAAGFNIVAPPCEGPSNETSNRSTLDIAARHGLKVWVSDTRFNETARTQPDWEHAVAEAARAYKDHPAFGGYFVTDEPSAVQFGDLEAIVGQLRTVDPGGLIYINLLADYVRDGLGTPTYRSYVEQFLEAIRPPVISYDYYVFGTAGDRSSFFDNLSVIRELALARHLPFMLIFLAMPHGPYRDPTEAELTWQAMHALAFGARGLSYFAYWTPVEVKYADVMNFRHGLVEGGRATDHYFQATRLNRTARVIADQLTGYQSVSVADSNGEIASGLPAGPIAAIEGGPVTVGLFSDVAGRRSALLVNRDYRRAITIRLRAVAGTPPFQRFDIDINDWVSGSASMQLAAGGAQLIRWAPP